MAVRDQSSGQFGGVIVDLAQELAKRLDVPFEFVPATSNLSAVDQVKNGGADRRAAHCQDESIYITNPATKRLSDPAANSCVP
jgi:hypothetical protein